MDIVNLVNAVQAWVFLRDEKMPFDMIMWETMPDELDKRYEHNDLSDLGYDFGVAGKLAAYHDKYPRMLVVVETLNALYLLPWLQWLQGNEKKSVTILQLNAGIASYMTKSSPDMTDIASLLPYIAVKEVYDLQSLLNTLVSGGSQYIRIPNGDTHDAVFPKPLKAIDGIIDLRDQWFEWVAGTIIAPGGVLVQTIQAVQHLQNEGKNFDLFALEEYNFGIGKALKESVIKTENIIMLLDQQRRTQYESVVKAKLWDSGLVDTQIHFVYPNAEKINTILPEYLREQANWDGLGIAEKINSIN